MFPTSTVSPDYAQLDKRIVPLVKSINALGLPTYYSCEGHEHARNLIQSSHPFVVITPEKDAESAHRWLRFMGMLGVYNTNCGRDDIRWKIVSMGNMSPAFHLEPDDTRCPLRMMQQSAVLLARILKRMDKWYQF